MKPRNYIYIACLYLGICAACHSGIEDEQDEPVDNREVSFRITQSDNPFARASSTGFEVGDSIGIFAVKRDVTGEPILPAASDNQANNAKWIKTLDGWMPASLKDKIVYPQDGASLDFYAYYPYNREAVNPTSIVVAVKSDQRTETKQKKSDWMAARNTRGINEGEVDLVFKHILSSVEVQIVAGNVIAPNDALQLQMTGIYHAKKYNIGLDKFTDDVETGVIDMRRMEQNAGADTYTYTALLPAQTLEAGNPVFRCLQDGMIYIYRGEEIILERGNRTRFIFSLKSGSE